MKKPLNIVYGVTDTPPVGVTVGSGFQHVVLVAIRLLFPLIVAREAGLPPDRVLDVLGVSMLIMGLSPVLQALSRGPVGSGYLCPASFTSAYIAPSLVAARTGGMALVVGMTLFGGVVEAALSRALRPLRPFFPPEIAGFVVVVVGVTLGSLGTRYVLGIGVSGSLHRLDLAVTAVSLGAMIVLNVWTRGSLRIFCAVIGMAVGYVAAALAGILTLADLGPVQAAPLLHFPRLAQAGWSFDLGLTIPFGIAALAACLRAMGDITTCQKINDAEWTRPSMRSVSGGVLANGLSTAAAGICGTIGVNTLTSSVGLTSATGVTSRRIAYVMGGMFALLAFVPKAAALFAIMPRPVLGATLWFSACFVFVNGLQIVTSRMLDVRRTFVIGLGFMIGLAVDLYPSLPGTLPSAFQPFATSSLVLGTISALVLNAVFRLGVRRTQLLVIDPARRDSGEIADFMEAQGGAWGARRDVIDRAAFNLSQSIETIVDSCEPEGPIEVQASFDEFNLNLRVSYTGPPLELPEKRPSNEEIMASEEGQRRLAGFMLRRYADRVQARHRAGRSTILFHFDH
jgi:NCS2 family nucleobase:cation symporter-2